MKTLPNSLFYLLCFLAFAWPRNATANPTDAILPPEAVANFTWFGTLGFPDVHECPTAHVTTGGWSQGGGESPQASPPVVAFLLRRNDGGHFTVLTPDLFTRDYTTTSPNTPEYQRVGCEETFFAAEADAYLDALARPPATDSGSRLRRFGERLSQRGEVFIWAWACWRNGLDERAARLYARAAAMPRRDARELEKTAFRERLESDLGYAMIWRATLDFGDPAIPRTRLLESFERIARDYPASEYAAQARETANLLRTMIAEDAAHVAPEPAGFSVEQRTTELIFRLRDQHGVQYSQPGSCDIFADDEFPRSTKTEEEKTPAMQLADLGFAAVPPLIAAIDDRRFTRSVGYGRDFFFSHRVLTVGDCAVRILSRIAGMPNYFYWANGTQISGENKMALIKARVESWWKDVQRKGEQQTLVDLVAAGGHDANEPAGRLRERDPEAALAALIRGAKNSPHDWVRARLVSLAGELPGDDAVPFFEEEMRSDPHLEERLAAANALWRHGRPDEAAAAMIHEWEKLQSVRHGEENQRDHLPQALIAFLIRCGRVDTVEALGRNLRRRLVSVRMDVVEAMTTPDPSLDFGSVGQGADDPTEVAAACEALLIGELDDGEERFGMNASIYGHPVVDPMIGDVAGEYLARRFPGKYTFDLGASPKSRERQRIECLNVWRKEHGQAPLPLPPENHVEPAPENVLLPALRALALSNDFAERRAADAILAKLGVSVLGPLRAFAATLPQREPGRTRLENAEKLLACTVTQTDLQISRPADEVWRPQFQAQMDAWKGKPLTSEEFAALTVDLAGKLCQGIGGIELRAVRDEDFGGVRVSLRLLPPDSQTKLPSRWESHQKVMLGNKALYSASGGTTPEILSRADQVKDWVHAADQALGAAADQPFLMVIFANEEL